MNRTLILSPLAAVLLASPALAAPNTWVASYGNDNGNLTCFRTTPCATFQWAHDKTDAGGTLTTVDSGDFGPLSITKSITVTATPFKAGVTGTAGTGINIQALDTDTIVLEGLTIDGRGTDSYGISVNKAAAVYVIDCKIKNFTQYGLVHNPVTTTSRVFVQRTSLMRNGNGIYAAGGSGHVLSVLDSLIDSSTQRSAIAEAGAIIGMARTVINASPTAIFTQTGGQAISIGPSNVVSGAGGFTGTAPFN